MKTINAKGKMKNAKWKILTSAICILPFAFLLLSGCAAFQVGGEIQPGRKALMYGDPKVAVAHFQRAAELDPNYLYFSVLPQGVWTYVGRADYAIGRIPEAVKALERARTRSSQDEMAKLYLGLALARDGNRERGLKELQGGMRGLHDWLEQIVYNTEYGQYWDPNQEIRSEIQRNLVVATGREPDLKSLIANGEWLGKRMEDEIDLARRPEGMERMG